MTTECQEPVPAPRSLRTLLRTILMLDDTPHSIALGTAIGMFVGMTPTVGVQMMIVLLIAVITQPLFRFNRVAGVLTVYVTNPLTIVPVYWFNYCVGGLFVRNTITYERFAQILEYNSLREWLATVSHLLSDVGWPLLLGSFLVASVCSILTYPAMLWLIRHVREDSGSRPGRARSESGVPTENDASPSAQHLSADRESSISKPVKETSARA